MQQELFNIPSDCEIVSTRIFNATAEQVFAAWTDPELLQQWWGPKGFTNTFHEFDLRPGGRWKFTMHGPEQGHYENECIFKIIDRPSLLVWDRLSQPVFRIVTTFDEATQGKTTVTFRMQFATARECAKIRPFAPEKNDENFDRLEKVLAAN